MNERTQLWLFLDIYENVPYFMFKTEIFINFQMS